MVITQNIFITLVCIAWGAVVCAFSLICTKRDIELKHVSTDWFLLLTLFLYVVPPVLIILTFNKFGIYLSSNDPMFTIGG